MNTKTIRGKTLGIFLSLVLVLSMAAVLLPVTPAQAATSITVTQPNGGECIKGGGNYIVKWTETSDGVVTADITVSTDNGATWSVPTSLGGLGPDVGPTPYQQSVTMPNTNSGICLVKVTISGPGDTTTSDVSDAVFKLDAQAPTVTLGSPLGGECWKGGTAHDVNWLSLDNFTGSLTYTLEYSINGGTSWAAITAPFSAAQGSQTFSWTLPVANASNCRVKITATDCAGNANTATSSNFTIDSTNPTVTVLQPNGGETLTAGASYNIQWNAIDNLPGNLTYLLEYSTTGCGGAYTAIGASFSGAQGSNTYSWTVPGVRTTFACIKVTATDCTGLNSTFDTSDATFTIQDTTAPVVTVTSPNGGESWANGSPHNITWTATDNVPGSLNYYLYYCTSFVDCPTCSIPIAGPILAAQGPNTFPWTVPLPVPPTTTNQCRIKVQAIDTATTPNSATDCSNNNFTILVGGTTTATVTSPAGSESWKGGTCHAISWNVTSSIAGDPAIIVLEYYNGGWNAIVTLRNRDQGAGAFNWAVPDDVAITKVRITATVGSISSPTVESNTFTVTAAEAGLTTATINLQAGWNLVSLAIMPTCCPSTSTSCGTSANSIDSILANAITLDRVDSVWYFTGGPSGTWQSYAPGAPSVLTRMIDGKAYWVKVTAGGGVAATYQGRKCPAPPDSPPTYTDYVAGWNMVGFKSTVGGVQLQNYLCGTCGTTYSVPAYSWDPALGYQSVNCATALTPGLGYWVYFLTPCTVSPGCN